MQSLLEALIGAGASMESTYLTIIALLDKAESLANNSDYVSAVDALLIGEAKQAFVESFAAANREHTLNGMQQKAALPSS